MGAGLAKSDLVVRPPKLPKPALGRSLASLARVPAAFRRKGAGEAVSRLPTEEESAAPVRPEPPSLGFRSIPRKEGDEVVVPETRLLTIEETDELWNLLFGSTACDDDVGRWIASCFAFVGAQNTAASAAGLPRCPWGLTQELGGPCGVLASVQAYVLRELLFPAMNSPLACIDDCCRSPSDASTAEPSAESSDMATSSESEADVSPVDSIFQFATEALVACFAVENPEACSSTAPSCPIGGLSNVLVERFAAVDPHELLVCALVRMLHNASTSEALVWADVIGREYITRHDFASPRDLAEWLMDQDILRCAEKGRSGRAVLSFVCSLALTRGIENVRGDMDDATASAPLIGLWGHCSQELTNLCICGRSASNVFDGDVCFEDGDDMMVLHGIRQRPPIGFLTSMEPLRLVEVGSLLKQPQYPMWVVGSGTHYTIMFTDECCVNHAVPPAGAGASTCPCCRSGCEGAESTSTRLWHYNGRADIRPAGPALTAIDLTLVPGRPEQPPVVLKHDKDPRIFAEILRSRWPSAEVSFPGASLDGLVSGAPRID